jgi:hypothetical protein
MPLLPTTTRSASRWAARSHSTSAGLPKRAWVSMRVSQARCAVSAARERVVSSSLLISSSQVRSAATGTAAAISPAATADGDSGFCTVTMCNTAPGWVAASSAATSTASDARSEPSVPTTIALNIVRLRCVPERRDASPRRFAIGGAPGSRPRDG